MAETLLHRIHLGEARLDRLRVRITVALAIGWGPVVVLGLLGRLLTGRPEPLLLDLSVHARLLVAVPLFLVADQLLDAQSRQALERVASEGFVGQGRRPRLDELVRQADRLRRARASQLTLAVLALLIGLSTLTGWLGAGGVVGAVSTRTLTAAVVWFDAVALPLFTFVLARSLWRWALWVRVLGGVSRLHLRLVPGHPDRRAGIGFLTLPSLAFHIPFLAAVACVLSGSWGAQMMLDGAHVQQFKSLFFAFVVVGELLALAPLLVFTPQLFIAAKTGRREYDALATEYQRRFRAQWIARPPGDTLLGAPDFQSLNDLGGQYREAVAKASPVVFDPRDAVALALVMLLPMLPLLVAAMPVTDLLAKLGKLLLGAR